MIIVISLLNDHPKPYLKVLENFRNYLSPDLLFISVTPQYDYKSVNYSIAILKNNLSSRYV